MALAHLGFSAVLPHAGGAPRRPRRKPALKLVRWLVAQCPMKQPGAIVLLMDESARFFGRWSRPRMRSRRFLPLKCLYEALTTGVVIGIPRLTYAWEHLRIGPGGMLDALPTLSDIRSAGFECPKHSGL